MIRTYVGKAVLTAIIAFWRFRTGSRDQALQITKECWEDAGTL